MLSRDRILKKQSTCDSLAGLLVGWLAGWLLRWLAGWLAGWLVSWQAGWLVITKNHTKHKPLPNGKEKNDSPSKRKRTMPP